MLQLRDLDFMTRVIDRFDRAAEKAVIDQTEAARDELKDTDAPAEQLDD